MPDVFVLINAVSIDRIVLRYFIKNAINVTIRRISHRKAVYKHRIDADCHNSAYFKYCVNCLLFLA